MLYVGEKARDFIVKNQNGRRFRLSDHFGRPLVLYTFHQAGAPACTAQARAFAELYPALEAIGVGLYGISTDEPHMLRYWKERRELPFDLLSDQHCQMLTDWGAWGHVLPGTTFTTARRAYWVLDAHGVVIDSQMNVGPKDSVAQVRKTLALTPYPVV